MGNIFISSDYHFNHLNVIKYCNRPFKSVEEMNETIIKNYNQMVKKDDICYNLGDFIFVGGVQAGKSKPNEFLHKLNGRHFLIRGNHCRNNGVADFIDSATANKCGIKWQLVHDPMNASTSYDVNLVGHVHNIFKFVELKEKNKKSLIINCGVDVWDFRPVSLTKLFEIYQQWKCGKIIVPVYDKEAVKKQRELRRKQK